MNLLRLLTAGKSLVGVKQEAGRYKLSDPRSMPKFGSAGNPFKPKLERKAAPAAIEEPGIPPVVERIIEPETEQAQAEAVAPAREAVASPPVEMGTFERKRRAKVSFLKRIWQRVPVRGTESCDVAVPVQGELSLDNIQVVRNDLSESDLEVVPLRTRPTALRAPAAPDCAGANVQEVEAPLLGAERG